MKENAADSSTMSCKLVSFADYDCKILFTSTLASALFRLLYWLHYFSCHYCDCFSWPGPSLIVAVIVVIHHNEPEPVIEAITGVWYHAVN